MKAFTINLNKYKHRLAYKRTLDSKINEGDTKSDQALLKGIKMLN